MNWLLAGGISIALTGLMLYIIYADHKVKKDQATNQREKP